jgi:hypothetical protein
MWGKIEEFDEDHFSTTAFKASRCICKKIPLFANQQTAARKMGRIMKFAFCPGIREQTEKNSRGTF